MNKQAYPSNTALKALSPIIGDWITEGTHGLLSGITLHGKASFGWHESGAFIMARSSVDDSRFPTGVEIIGSDNELGTFTMIYYDDRGISRHYEVSMENNVLKRWRNAPGFSQRYSLTISKDQQTMIGKGEICKDGSTWEKDLDLMYKKVT